MHGVVLVAGAAVAVALTLYLLVALVRPEWF
jgi:K+-transporting ATPase KdpF subunit